MLTICEGPEENNFTTHIFWVLYFEFYIISRVYILKYCYHKNLSRSLRHNLGISIIVGRAFILSVDKRPCLTLSAIVLHCFHLETIFKFGGATILIKRWKEMIITPRRILLAQKHDQSKFFNYEIIQHAKLILLTDFHKYVVVARF